MMSGHAANPIFFNQNYIGWKSRTLATHPHPPLMSDNISFLPHLKVEVMCVSPLKMQHKFLIKLGTCYNRLFELK